MQRIPAYVIRRLSHYEVLGVSSAAPKAEIRKAFRAKAVLCHPDKFPNEPEKNKEFLEISAAYEILSNNTKRADYDKSQDSDYFSLNLPLRNWNGSSSSQFDFVHPFRWII